VRRLPSTEPATGDVRQQPAPDEEVTPGSEVGSTMRAVAPPIQSFAMGRRR
jgi:hypothetical protein